MRLQLSALRCRCTSILVNLHSNHWQLSGSSLRLGLWLSQAGVLLSLAALCMEREVARQQLIDARAVPLVVRALEDPHLQVRRL